MLVPLSWLKEYVEFDMTQEELSRLLTMQGLEVESSKNKKDEGILEIDVTPNRGDCLSILGIAREVSCLTKNPIRYPDIGGFVDSEAEEAFIKIQILDRELCQRYVSCLVRDVEVSSSPPWLKKALLEVGIRPVNNIVDVTNFVLMESGQPLHAFDYNKLAEREIIVRRAEFGEVLVTIDGIQRSLDPDILVIADPKGPIAIAGIMGGKESEISGDTKDVLLESAYFTPSVIRWGSKILGLQTESSYRFERGVDPCGQIFAIKRAALLISEVSGGKIVPKVIEEGFIKPSLALSLSCKKVNKVLGLRLSEATISNILRRLGFEVVSEGGAKLKVSPPSFRQDVTREIDLIEEIARVYGYDKIPTTLPAERTQEIVKETEYELAEEVRKVLCACGLYEVITYSFTNVSELKRWGVSVAEERVVKVRNALSEETNIMRPLLYPSLLQVIQRNLNRGVSRVRIFELARIFESRDRGEVPCERWVLGGAISGKTGEDGWIDRFRDVGFFDIIGIIKRLFQELGIRGYLFESGYNTSFHPKNFIEIMVEEKKIGFAGEVHPAIISSQGLQPVFLFELDWDLVKELSNPKRTYIPIPKYPPIYRDIAIIVKDEVPSGKIYQQILDTGGHLIDSIKLFDVYHGPQIPKGHKSLAYSITYKRSSSTLTDDEVNPVHAEIIRVLCDRFGARLR